jgi:hypothetical protein
MRSGRSNSRSISLMAATYAPWCSLKGQRMAPPLSFDTRSQPTQMLRTAVRTIGSSAERSTATSLNRSLRQGRRCVTYRSNHEVDSALFLYDSILVRAAWQSGGGEPFDALAADLHR